MSRHNLHRRLKCPTMNQDQWTAVDQYINELLVPSDPALEATLRSTVEAGMPQINVAPNQGKLLQVLAMSIGAKSILEIGTLAGFSTIFLARALPIGGKLITLEYEPQHAEVAAANIKRAGLTDRVEIRVGAALDTLPNLVAENRGPFDLIFIDADKVNTANYFAWALNLSRPGSLIITDNVVRKGKVIEGHSSDQAVQGVRRFNTALAAEPRVTATIVQTVGLKGYDGFAIAVVNGQ